MDLVWFGGFHYSPLWFLCAFWKGRSESPVRCTREGWWGMTSATWHRDVFSIKSWFFSRWKGWGFNMSVGTHVGWALQTATLFLKLCSLWLPAFSANWIRPTPTQRVGDQVQNQRLHWILPLSEEQSAQNIALIFNRELEKSWSSQVGVGRVPYPELAAGC